MSHLGIHQRNFLEQMDTDANAARTEIAQLQETIEEYKKECLAAKTDMQKLTVS